MHQEQTERSKLKGIRRKPVSIAQNDLVTTDQFKPEQKLPLVVRPNRGDVNLVLWVRDHLDWIEEKVLIHGGILFRDFDVPTPKVMEEVVSAITPELLNYIEGSSPRVMITDKVYTSTEYPPEFFVSMHNELSYAHKWPGKIYFHCAVEPQEGGETPFADSREVLARLDPKLKKRFIEKGVVYLRNLHGGRGAGLSWQTVFETEDREAVEAYCQEGKITFEWTRRNGLKTRQERPAVVTHPQTGEDVWFNQVDQWHTSNLEPEYRKALLAAMKEEDFPIYATFGDGSPLDDEELDHIRDVFKEVMVTFPWKKGDILVGDNTLIAHGRMPFKGPRKVLVAMGGLVTLEEAGAEF